MRVLMLTWEFPPVITGGLGIACYGMAKALLKHGIEIDLVMPARQAVYFPLRSAKDADDMPLVFTLGGKYKKSQAFTSTEQLRKLLGNPVSVYHTIGQSRPFKHGPGNPRRSNPFSRLFEILSDDYYLFRQVGDYTYMAVDTASQLDFDIIHAHDWLVYPAGMLLKRLTGRPLVTHVHATEFDRAGGAGDGRIHHVEYMAMEYADRIITVSDYTARTVAEKYHISLAKTTVVHNAYSLPDSEDNHRRIFKEPTVLFMGRITLQKGPDYFLEVARRVLQYEQRVRFVMAGSGDMERHLLHKAASLGLGTKFLFAGFLERQEVASILSSADIFLLPSVSEPFGIAPLEAMSLGAIAIVSKNAGVAEVIENAYKVDFWDIDQMVSIIIELIRDPAKFKEMSSRGKAEVTNLQWENAVRKIMEVFSKLEQPEKCSI